MRKQVIFVMMIAGLIFSGEIALAKIPIPGRSEKMVNDYAGIVDEPTKRTIEELSASIRNKSSDPVEVIVTTFASLDGWRFDEFRKEYGEKWRLTRKGSKYRDNGVIILVVLNEKKVSVGAGQNLKSILTDAVINDIMQNEILPEFKKGSFSSGIKKGVEKIINILNNSKIPVDSPIFNLGNLALLILLIIAFRIIKKYKNT